MLLDVSNKLAELERRMDPSIQVDNVFHEAPGSVVAKASGAKALARTTATKAAGSGKCKANPSVFFELTGQTEPECPMVRIISCVLAVVVNSSVMEHYLGDALEIGLLASASPCIVNLTVF